MLYENFFDGEKLGFFDKNTRFKLVFREQNIFVLGCFDGNGKHGYHYAERAKHHFMKNIYPFATGPDANIPHAWIDALCGMFEDVQEKLRYESGSLSGGTTATIVVCGCSPKNNWVVTANVGDTEVKLYKKASGEMFTLTMRHSPDNELELERLKIGGFTQWQPCYDHVDNRIRLPIFDEEGDKNPVPETYDEKIAAGYIASSVNGKLSSYMAIENGSGEPVKVTRSLGNFPLSRYGMISAPSIGDTFFNDDEYYLIVASNVFWDLNEDDTIGSVLSQCRQSMQNAEELLANTHLARDTFPNQRTRYDSIALMIARFPMYRPGFNTILEEALKRW